MRKLQAFLLSLVLIVVAGIVGATFLRPAVTKAQHSYGVSAFVVQPASPTPAEGEVEPGDVPELGYCKMVDSVVWSGTQTHSIKIRVCTAPSEEWVRANPGKRISPADTVPVDTPSAILPAISQRVDAASP